MVRACEAACAKVARKSGDLPIKNSEAKFISKTILVNVQTRLRRGAGRAIGVATASCTTPVTLPYFLKFWWGRGDVNRRRPGSWTVVFNGTKQNLQSNRRYSGLQKLVHQVQFACFALICVIARCRYFGGWVDAETPGPRSFVDFNPKKFGHKGSIVVRCKWQTVVNVDFGGFNGERQRTITIRFPIHSS